MPLKDGSLEEYASAAARQYLDACKLAAVNRLDNAGHLMGFAAECAIKHQIGLVSPTDNPQLHIPDLLPAARRRLGKRVNYAGMYNIIKDDILPGWSVDQRYSADGNITEGALSNWTLTTRRLLGAAGIRVAAS